MAFKRSINNNIAYGFSDALLGLPEAPIIAVRAPSTADVAALGTMWIDKATDNSYQLTSRAAGSSTWTGVTTGTGAFAVLSSNTTLAVGTDSTLVGTLDVGGATTLSAAVTVESGVGAINISADDAATTINIGKGAGAKTLTLGSLNTTSQTLIQGGTGDITFNAPIVQLTSDSGGTAVNLYTGAGVPANGLAIQAGDLYFRSDPGGATERIYVATGAGAWTNITCAA